MTSEAPIQRRNGLKREMAETLPTASRMRNVTTRPVTACSKIAYCTSRRTDGSTPAARLYARSVSLPDKYLWITLDRSV